MTTPHTKISPNDTLSNSNQNSQEVVSPIKSAPESTLSNSEQSLAPRGKGRPAGTKNKPGSKAGRPKGSLGFEKKLELERQEVLRARAEKEAATIKTSGRVLNLEFPLSERQKMAMYEECQFLLYGGAKGGGKSWWACVWIIYQALKYKGNKLFFFRRRSVDFTNTTLETWKKVVPSNLYKINEQKKKIYVKYTNSVIDYGGLDDPMLIQSLNSAEYGGGCVDQAEEIEKDSFGMLRGTLRHKLMDGSFPSYQVRFTANPAQCWLKDDFITMPKKGFKFIPALPTDNPFLPPTYVENLREAFQHRPALLAAYLEGSWDDLSGHDLCIQPNWVDASKGKMPRDGVLKRIVVNDPARFGDDENVILVMEETPNCAYIVEKVILEHKSLMDTAGRLSALRKKHNATMIAVDSIGIGSGVVDALIDLGENVLSINSSSKPTSETTNERYFNLRSQMWMEAGSKFSDGKVSLLSEKDDYTMLSQLTSTKFKFANGKMQAESKDDIKKRIGNSPDRADALVMGLYALSQVERLDAEEYKEKVSGRYLEGTLVDDEYSMGQRDFSGYAGAY
jgi:hypothetical protein